jgi:uncharacterized protein YdhG (YjbR/CyaY superfamily)
VQKPASVDAYVETAPIAQRPELANVRALIRKHFPRANELLGSSGFPVYTDADGTWLAGFAWRKKGPMLYVMNAVVLDRYDERLGELRSGKSCVEWRATKGLSIEQLTELADAMLKEAQWRFAATVRSVIVAPPCGDDAAVASSEGADGNRDPGGARC